MNSKEIRREIEGRRKISLWFDETLQKPIGLCEIGGLVIEEEVGNNVLGKLNHQEKKAQMAERRKISLWLNTKLMELEEEHLANRGGTNEKR